MNDWTDVGLIYIGLMVFGYVYNRLIQWTVRKRFLEGFTWLAVLVGVLVTLGGLALLVDWKFSLLALGAFASSGLPMVAGSLLRYVQARHHEQEELRNWSDVG
jgi:hypothetical protein